MKKKLYLTIFLSLVFLLSGRNTYAATLSISPNTSTISVNNIVTVRVIVNTSTKYINNSEATIQFPIDLLEVVSINKNPSIFSLWVEEPNFSNYTGKITFNGGIATPGFNGGSGTICSITFKAKKQGTASIIFTDGAVRENNGLGTDILTSKNSGVVQITTAPVTPPKEKVPVEKVNTPFMPTVRFDGIQGIIKLSDEKNIYNIDYFTILLDEKTNLKVKKEQLIRYEYNLPILNEGRHSATIVSFDKTGKYTENVLTFMSPVISSPTLELSSKEIVVGDSVNILGKTDYPNKQVNVILEQDGKEIKRYIQTTGTDGLFTVVTDKMSNLGLVSIYAETLLSDTVKSGPSEKVYLKVNETEVVKVTLAILYPLISLLLIIIIILIIFFLLYLGWHKYFGLKKKIEHDKKQTIEEVHKAMLLLKEELNDQLKSLEKIKIDRNLNEKEEIIFSEIEKNINDIDDFIKKKLNKIT